MGLYKYAKAAFLLPWNLLAVGAGLGLAVLSFDANLATLITSLVLAGEVGYLGFFGTHPKFQKYIDAQEARGTQEQAAVGAEQALKRIMEGLPPQAVKRFETLRARCRELRQIAVHLRDPAQPLEPLPLENVQIEGLDRLLWIYLRLLYTQNALDRFLTKTSEKEIRDAVSDLQGRLRSLPPENTEQKERIRKSLEDNLETSQARLKNFQKAKDQQELVRLEIERLENKIHSLSELAVNRQEPNFISEQVDQVASSMVHTERTMSDLQFATGLPVADEEVPKLMQRQTAR